MYLKKGDKVQVIAGKDKGKTGTILKTLKAESRVIVENVNIIKKHMKPDGAGNEGGIIEMEAPIHSSNVMIIDPKTKKPTRVGHVIDEKTGKKQRVGVKSKENLK